MEITAAALRQPDRRYEPELVHLAEPGPRATTPVLIP